jgi:uncharacterized protein (TIGR02996 family)
MKERSAFLRALAKNEDDTKTRLAYADWLDENGEHEEADRQRRWPAANWWLFQFCQDNNSSDKGASVERVISCEMLIQLGRESIQRADKEGIGFGCWNNMRMSRALNENSHEFWKNWSIVTGIAVPKDAADKSFFRCSC